MSQPLYPSSRHDRPHARIYDHHISHPAWKDLSGNALKLIVRLLANYRPAKPNSFPVGGRRVADLIGVSEKTGNKVVDELIAKGHLREERKGTNTGALRTRERVVSLTRHDTELHAGDPEWPIKVWKAGKKLVDGRGKNSGSENSNTKRKPNDNGATIVPLKTTNTHM